LIGVCDICEKETEVCVCSSTMGAVSLAYCKECERKDLEPYGIMVAYISCAGKFPEDINEGYQTKVRRILQELNISEEQFIEDCNKANEEYDKYLEHLESVDTSITDEVGGTHDEGLGWNPQGVFCGECGKISCKDCYAVNKTLNES
jgi:hypothetical protein